ncbi:MAG: hypothetical protein ACKOUT_10670 [Novosphingobium sp.]
MPRYKMIALTKPIEGRDEEFNAWYQNVHLVELCAMPGVTGAQRYKLAAPLQGYDERPYLAIYDIECDDIRQTLGAIGAASASGKMTQSDAADSASAYTVVFEEFGERVEG